MGVGVWLALFGVRKIVYSFKKFKNIFKNIFQNFEKLFLAFNFSDHIYKIFKNNSTL
jgi:hypothetical protein